MVPDLWALPRGQSHADQLVSIAEADRLDRAAHRAARATAQRAAVAAAIGAVRTGLPPGWHAQPHEPGPDGPATITVAPPASPLEVTASLYPPAGSPGWHVQVRIRAHIRVNLRTNLRTNQVTRRVAFPLYAPGGARVAEYPDPVTALAAAVAAVTRELVHPTL